MPVKPLLPEGLAIWSSRLAVAVALVCAVLALITGLTKVYVLATATNWFLAGLGALLYAIWVVLLQIYFYGVRTRSA